MHRVLAPGGVVSFTVYEDVDWTQHVKVAANSIRGCPAWPDNKDAFMMIASGNAWHEEDFVRGKLSEHGFHRVDSVTVSKTIELSPEDFAGAFCESVAKAMCGFFWGAEKAATYGPQLAGATLDLFRSKGVHQVPVTMRYVVYIGKKAA